MKTNPVTFYYSVPLDSARGKRIAEFISFGRKASEAADRLASKLGADSRTDRPGRLFPGVGIGSLKFSARPDKKKYRSIGKGEYIPNFNTPSGMELARQIARLPDITAIDFCAAFGISADKKATPEWFVSKGKVFISSHYRMGEEYMPIPQTEFESEKANAE